MAYDCSKMTRCLEVWARRHYGDEIRVLNVYRMPGNSGISFGFDVVGADRYHPDRLVIRVPPEGVRRQGNTDVLRQVPLLEVLTAEGVPVPAVRHWGEDESWFGAPYLMVERVSGRSLDFLNPDPVFDLSPSGVRALFAQAVHALVQIHRVSWEDRLPGWESARSLKDEIEIWAPLFGRSLDPTWSEQGAQVREGLHATVPAEPHPGLVHGDFHSNNWIFEGGELQAVVDWEIAEIGPSLLDLGWLCMFFDVDSWGPTRRAGMSWAPAPLETIRLYEETADRPVPDIDWYRALAAYRFAAITALNLRLHRTGRRHDPAWEVYGESFPYLLRRAEELLRRP